MKTHSRVGLRALAVVAALGTFVCPVNMLAESESVPMSLKGNVTFGLWTEEGPLDPWQSKYQIRDFIVYGKDGVKDGRWKGKLYQVFDAPGPGYFRQRDRFDEMIADLQK